MKELIRTLEKLQSFGYGFYIYTIMKDYNEALGDYTERAVIFYKNGNTSDDDCVDIDITKKMAGLIAEDILPVYGDLAEAIETLKGLTNK